MKIKYKGVFNFELHVIINAIFFLLYEFTKEMMKINILLIKWQKQEYIALSIFITLKNH